VRDQPEYDQQESDNEKQKEQSPGPQPPRLPRGSLPRDNLPLDDRGGIILRLRSAGLHGLSLLTKMRCPLIMWILGFRNLTVLLDCGPNTTMGFSLWNKPVKIPHFPSKITLQSDCRDPECKPSQRLLLMSSRVLLNAISLRPFRLTAAVMRNAPRRRER
jgi:hypothetical protein